MHEAEMKAVEAKKQAVSLTSSVSNTT
jgi:hypothetical protein